MWGKGMYMCVCDWATLLCSRKLTERCKPTLMEKKKSLNKKKKKKSVNNPGRGHSIKWWFQQTLFSFNLLSLLQDLAPLIPPSLEHTRLFVAPQQSSSPPAHFLFFLRVLCGFFSLHPFANIGASPSVSCSEAPPGPSLLTEQGHDQETRKRAELKVSSSASTYDLDKLIQCSKSPHW